ncbi:MAG: hypothetical protein RR848_04095, partial [Oscillospiraceae bacterium]
RARVVILHWVVHSGCNGITLHCTHIDCKMQSFCKNLTGGAEPPPLRRLQNAAKLQNPHGRGRCTDKTTAAVLKEHR